MPVAVEIFYDRRLLRKKTQDYPVKLRVYHLEARLYTTIYGISQADYDRLEAKRVSAGMQAFRKKLKDFEKRATDAADALTPLDFKEFERNFIAGNAEIDQRKLKIEAALPADQPFDFAPYYKKFPILLETPPHGTIGQVFLHTIKCKLVFGKVTTALSYQCSYTSLVKYGGNMPFHKVTPLFLQMYGEWMKELGNSNTTTGIK